MYGGDDTEIEIYTEEKGLVEELFGIKKGDKIQITDNAELTYKGTMEFKEFDYPNIIKFTIDIIADLATIAYVARWFYEKFKKRASYIQFERKIAKIEEGEIREVIEEELEVSSR